MFWQGHNFEVLGVEEISDENTVAAGNRRQKYMGGINSPDFNTPPKRCPIKWYTEPFLTRKTRLKEKKRGFQTTMFPSKKCMNLNAGYQNPVN